MNGLEGKCPRCGSHYCGWALQSQRNQTCEHCGVALKITDGRGNTFSGYSPFTAEKYVLKLSPHVPSPEYRIKEEPR
jgi:hypothetical protein